MTDYEGFTTSYTYSTNDPNAGSLDLDELAKLMKEFREKLDDDISRALFHCLK